MAYYLSFDISTEGKHSKTSSNDTFLILWGDETLAYVPSCLEGVDNGINVT
jgi:hypothetical protein